MATAAVQPDLSKLTEALKDLNFEGLSKDFEEYCQVVKDAIPEGEKKDNITGDISGHSFDYEVKSIDVTVGTVKDIMSAVINKAKDDDVLKQQLAKAGITEDQYSKLIDQLNSSVDSMTGDQLDKKLFTVDMYSYEGEDVGFALDLTGMGSIKMVSINTENVFAIDLNASFSSSSLGLTGAFELKDDTMDGSASLNISSNGSETANASLTVKDLKSDGNAFSGSIALNVNSEDNQFGMNIVSASTEDNLDVKLGVEYNSKKAFDLALTGEKTGASDVTIPSGTMYKMDKDGLAEYEKTSDVDGFMNHIKEVLGEELANKITSKTAIGSATGTTVDDGGQYDSENSGWNF